MVKNLWIQNFFNYSKGNRLKSIFWGSILFGLNRFKIIIEELKYRELRKRYQGNFELVAIPVNDYFLYLSPKEVGIHRDLIIHGIREPFSTKFLSGLIEPDDIIIEIGANIGYYAILESKLASNGVIHAIEPLPENVELLTKNIELNECNNIHQYSFAIGAEEGNRKLLVYDKCNWTSFTKNPEGIVIDEIDMPITTLDSLVFNSIKKCPSIIRMDVEGFECQIIKGALRLLKESSNLKLFIELHPHLVSVEDMDEMLGILRDNGYEVEAIFQEPFPYDYDFIGISNNIRRKAGISEDGLIGNCYEDLERRLSMKNSCEVFFVKR